MTAHAEPLGGRETDILVVCTGNVCRSPFVELSLRAALHEAGSPTTVGSAGTGALVGEPVDPPMAKLMVKRGLDPSGFAARQLDREHLEQAGLVVTASREHRAAVAHLLPAALGKVFTLRQLARLLGTVEPSAGRGPLSAAEVAQLASSRRGFGGPSAGDKDDVQDPYQRGRTHYRHAVGEMTPAIDVLVAFLTGEHDRRNGAH